MRYTTPTYLQPTGYFNNRTGNWQPRAHGQGGAYPYHIVRNGVPVPNPSPPPPTSGHWRTEVTQPTTPKPRTNPKPTSGRGMPRMAGNGKRARRKPAKKSTSAATLHSLWAQGKL